VSVREVYHRIKSLYGIHHDLIRQLYWREFYYGLSYNRQDMLSDATSFRESYDKITWGKSSNSKKLLEKWKNGTTGYPIVDAGMRELNLTGYMHNRARLITSNFLVKHLFIDWREGEKYFASKLIDYDPSVNNGNWQFTSGSGADSQPFFRMMNPWTQGERHDPKCAYIKAWIPELETVADDDIHNWQSAYKNYKDINYPAPCKIYDFNKLKKESKKVYSKAFK
jgi:deoxyribodipyrimidine photo-lyase